MSAGTDEDQQVIEQIHEMLEEAEAGSSESGSDYDVILCDSDDGMVIDLSAALVDTKHHCLDICLRYARLMPSSTVSTAKGVATWSAIAHSPSRC